MISFLFSQTSCGNKHERPKGNRIKRNIKKEKKKDAQLFMLTEKR